MKSIGEELRFSDRELDEFLGQWLSKGLSYAELEEWRKILTYETKLREEFCHWIKSLRDPGWIRLSSKKGKAI